MHRHLIRCSLVVLAACALLWGLLARRGADAGNILQSSGIDVNDPMDPFDDQAVLYRQRWSSDSMPVRFYLYRLPQAFGGDVMNPVNYNEPDGTYIDPMDIRLQLEQCIGSWNGCDFSDFQFAEFLNFADEMRPFTDPPTPFAVDRVALDGINLITFQEPVIALGAGVLSSSSLFILNEDFDVGAFSLHFPSAILDQTEAGATIVDWDQDGEADLILQTRTYEQGEIVDADILFDSLGPDYVLWPEDMGDLEVPQEDIIGTADIAALTTHELGRAHGLAIANLYTPVMYQSVIDVVVNGVGTFLSNPYAKRRPLYDDFVSQALQYPAGQPSDLGAFAGQVLDGDFLDLVSLAGEPANPFVLQIPVYLCHPALNIDPHPDNTDFLMNSDGSFGPDGGQTASFFGGVDPPLPMTFRRVASVPTGLQLRVNLFGAGGATAPPEALDSSFLIPGVPIRDDYAIYIDNPRLGNVNDVMDTIAAGNTPFPPEFYGGASGPPIGNGYSSVSDSPGDAKLTNDFIEVYLDTQARVSVGVPGRPGAEGLGLTSGHAVPEKNYAVFRVDNHVINTGEQFPGDIISPVLVNDPAKMGTGRWRIDNKVALQWEVRLTTAGGTDLETPPVRENDVSVTYRFENISNNPVELELRHVWDLVAVGREGPVYLVDGVPLEQTTTFLAPLVPKYIVFQDSPASPLLKGVLSLTGAGTGPNPPVKVVVDKMSRIDSGGFTLTAGGSSITGNTGRFVNTGAEIFFGPRSLAPGAMTSFTVVIGSLIDASRSLKDTGYRTTDAVGTIFYDDPNVAERLVALPGFVVEGINIITDTADGIPGSYPNQPPVTPPAGAIFDMNNDLVPTENWNSVHGATADIDNDGDLDIVVIVSGAKAGVPGHNRLLENRLIPDGSLRFVDVTYGKDGMPYTPDDRLPPDESTHAGAAMADFDNDGFMDVFVSNYGDNNRLYHNRGDGSFEDWTFLEPFPGQAVVPGLLDLDPVSWGQDFSGIPSAGDIDSDGDIDLVIPLQEPIYGYEYIFDGMLTEMFQDEDYGLKDEKNRNYDGLFFPAPMTGGENYEVDVLQGPAMTNCRILVNQLMETGALYFIDDTLGADHMFAGFQPLGDDIYFENVDRMPPLLPDMGQTMTSSEADYPYFAGRALLANFTGDNALDLLLAENTYATSVDFPKSPNIQPYMRLYNNIDAVRANLGFDNLDDMRPDGFFQQVNFGCDWVFFPWFDGDQSDLFPFLVSLPSSFPESSGPNPGPSNGQDCFAVPRANIQGLAVADLRYLGVFAPIAAAFTGDSYAFTRKYLDNRGGAQYEMGALRGLNGYVGGMAPDFYNQRYADPNTLQAYDQNVTALADRFDQLCEVFDQSLAVNPPPPPPPPWIGVEWDLAEASPFDVSALNPGDEFEGSIRYDISLTVGGWDRMDIPTADGQKTWDVVAADFDMDGDNDLFFANDIIGNEASSAGAAPAPNTYFENNGEGALTNTTAAALVMEPAAYSRAAILGDFDNDADPDLYICNYGAQNHLLLNYTFHKAPILSSPEDAPLFYDASVRYLPPSWQATYSAAVADLNADGRPDIVTGNGGFDYFEDNFIFFNIGEPLNQGVHILQPHNSPFPAPATFQPVDRVNSSLWRNSGMFDYGSEQTTDVALGDLDNDGDYDMLDVNYGLGPRFFTNEDSDSPDLPYFDYMLSNMPDADDIGDGIFLQQDYSLPLLENPLCFYSGVPDPKKLVNTCLALADFTGDGRLDVVIGNRVKDIGAPNVLLINHDVLGQVIFTDETETRLPTVTFPVEVSPGDCTQGLSDDTVDVAAGDFNGDGFIDIFFANSRNPAYPDLPGSRLLLNDGTGVFYDAPGGMLPPLPDGEVGCVAIGDFVGFGGFGDLVGFGEPTEDINYNGVLDPGFDIDGDGLLDTGEDSINSRRAANLGGIPGMSDNGQLDFLDLNGNGIADLHLDIYIGYVDRPDVLLINDGAGHFIDASNQIPQVNLSIKTQGIDVGDVNLDGYLDIVLALNLQDLINPVTGPNCALLLNNGSGGFYDASYEVPEFTAGASSGNGRDVDLVDLDLDGDLDIFFSQIGFGEGGAPGTSWNYVMINRVIGANHNAERTTVAQVPGKPVLKSVSPPGGVPGQTLKVTVAGYNLEQGSTFDFGPGVSVVDTPAFIDTRLCQMHVGVDAQAAVGPRVVQVHTPSGKTGVSRLGLFSVLSSIPGGFHDSAADSSWTLYEVQTADSLVRRAPPRRQAAYQ